MILHACQNVFHFVIRHNPALKTPEFDQAKNDLHVVVVLRDVVHSKKKVLLVHSTVLLTLRAINFLTIRAKKRSIGKLFLRTFEVVK